MRRPGSPPGRQPRPIRDSLRPANSTTTAGPGFSTDTDYAARPTRWLDRRCRAGDVAEKHGQKT